jgi:multidrug efflux pump subunit AcrB
MLTCTHSASLWLFIYKHFFILTPREEDPQIIVPVMDVMIEFPGASAEEVEKLVTTPLESLLKQIEGVEYVYSAASPGMGMVTVRYYVGEELEDGCAMSN